VEKNNGEDAISLNNFGGTRNVKKKNIFREAITFPAPLAESHSDILFVIMGERCSAGQFQ